MVRLNYLLLADEVSKTSGKTNIIGIFAQIHCSRLPSTHPKMALVGQLSGLEKGKHALEVRFLDTDQNDYVPPVSVTVESDGFAPSDFVVNIHNFPIVEFSATFKFVTVQVRLQNEVLGSTDLELRRMTQD